MNQIVCGFDEQSILITGGTGTIGERLVKRLLQSNCKKIVILSRDEDKQFHMQQRYKDERVHFVLGDIVNREFLDAVMQGIDLVINLAAIKHVAAAESNPLAAVNTNVYGTYNVMLGAILAGVKKVILFSTDKAVAPTNCMGMTKRISEQLMQAMCRMSCQTEIVCVRLGNVIGSRGSVLVLWQNQIKGNQEITVTDTAMTRFFMTTDDVIRLVEHALLYAKPGEIVLPEMRSCNVYLMAKIFCQLNCTSFDRILITGAKPGEKLHEELFTKDEEQYIYCINQFLHIGRNRLNSPMAIKRSSNEAPLMSSDEIASLLKSTNYN